MSEIARRRALERLTLEGAVLAACAQGKGFGVFPKGDRRRRPIARLTEDDVRDLESSGAIVAGARGYVLSAAGFSATRRDAAPQEEAYLAQHVHITDRTTVDERGGLRTVRGAQSQGLLRLAHLRDASGAPWLNAAELRAAQALRQDWEIAQAGLVSGSDLAAAPMSGTARAANAQEAAMARRCDARRRFNLALDALAPPLRRVVERVCLHDEGLESLERAENWPARSAKLALKLGLAQLAQALSG